jgi:hypothetical protein
MYRSAAVAAAGFVLCAISGWLDLHALLLAWLTAAVTIASIGVGSLAVLMIAYLVRGQWTEELHRPLTAAALTLPGILLLFVPVLLGLHELYPWAHEAAKPGSMKAVYLTPGFFALRTIAYFVIWTGLALVVRAAWGIPKRMVATASGGLIVYALTASFAGIDWLESLTPEFHSSLYGLMLLTFQLIAGYAFAVMIALSRRGATAGSYGAIMIACLLMWAYNYAMQYIIIWSGNLPKEVTWYTARESGVWGFVLWAVVVCQFFVPFFALLSSRIRNRRQPLVAIAAATVMLRFVEAGLLAMPEAGGSSTVMLLAAPGAVLLAGALWWIGFTIALQFVTSSVHDSRMLAEGFDAAGNPLPLPRQR